MVMERDIDGVRGCASALYHECSGEDKLDAQGHLDPVLGGDGIDVGGNKGREEADAQADGRDDEGEHEGAPAGVA